MGMGIEAVRDEIEQEFGDVSISGREDFDADSFVLSFSADGRKYKARISREFDNDYGSGTTVSLRGLGARLRTSQSGEVTVRTSGIS